MQKKRKWELWYVTHVIKKSFLFYAFLLFGIILFLTLSMAIKIDNGSNLLQQIFLNAGKTL